MSYSQKVLDHYHHPSNIGSFKATDNQIGTGIIGSAESGELIKIQIKVHPETGVVEDARFKTFGCTATIALSSLATEWVKGKTLEEAAAIHGEDLANELDLPPDKIPNAIRVVQALHAALANYGTSHE